MESKVYQGQSFLDKTIEMTGSIENVFSLALENNVSITDLLVTGEKLTYSGKIIKSIGALFSDRNRCATQITAQDYTIVIPDEGVGAMTIEDTFIIR